jgi:oxygen-independent coproporphyrinogen III oxidase
VHVPFCAVRCTYCDFSTGSLSEAGVERWLVALGREIERRAPAAAGMRFHSVFFGGGTPSTLTPAQFGRMWRALRSGFEVDAGAEVTLEANPESAREDRFEAWSAAGVNRLSFGAQSFDAGELRTLGRVHDADRPAEAMRLARAHGFRRLSLDLMFGFPGHTARTWEHTLEAVLELDPEHVSAYCFIPEAGTPLGDAIATGGAALPDDAEQADRYARIEERLGGAGFACYETSNFCRPGAEARHNLVYWLRRPYLGLGPSAHGHLGGRRYGNHYDRGAWALALERGELPEAESEVETEESRAREIVMLGLRLACGLHAEDYPAADWAGVCARYGAAFDRALAQGRLERCGEGLRVAPAHRFVADDVIAWLDAAATTG